MAITGVKTHNAPGDTQTSNIPPGRLVAFNCTTAGNVTFHLHDGTSHVVPVALGYQEWPYAVRRIMATGTTAVVDASGYRNLY